MMPEEGRCQAWGAKWSTCNMKGYEFGYFLGGYMFLDIFWGLYVPGYFLGAICSWIFLMNILRFV